MSHGLLPVGTKPESDIKYIVCERLALGMLHTHQTDWPEGALYMYPSRMEASLRLGKLKIVLILITLGAQLMIPEGLVKQKLKLDRIENICTSERSHTFAYTS